MTRINKLVMHGFKSFARHTEIPFQDQYNCILGPNGSGKSNVLDALCFVLGKTSAKSMRAEKSSNLIYNGGKLKKPARQGEVSIYFDNESRRFPTDDKEIKITRIVRPNGQSIYRINDKARTRQQIQDLLSIAKIDPDGYNIILQGDIVKFVEMNPVERRLLIEEISGISIYEEKKEKALRELEKVDSRLSESEIILKERSAYLKDLKKDRDQALKYKEMSDRIKTYKASLLSIQISQKEKEEAKVQKILHESKEKLAKEEEEIAKLRKENEDSRAKIEEITREIEEKGEKDQVELNKKIEEIRVEIARKESRQSACASEIDKVRKRREDLKNAIISIEDKMAELSSQLKGYQSQRSALEKERAAIKAKIDRFREKNSLEDVAKLDEQVEQADKSAEHLQKEIHSLRERQHGLIREKDRLSHEINTVEEAISKVKILEKEYKGQLDALKQKRDEFKSATLGLNKRLNEDSSLAARSAKAQKELQDAQEELAKLRVKEAGIKEFTAGDMAIQKILEQKDRIGGIHGTVAELGKVKSRYSLALETAAGSKIKSIVVDSDATAVKCIKYLKSSRLGTATFLPLNKLRGHKADDKVKKLSKANGCEGLAIDLVDYDSRYRDVFSYVFADTLVIDNIDVSRRIGVGSAKMVTLDGDSADTHGAMRGGFKSKKKGSLGFSQEEVASRIRSIEEGISEKESLVSALKNSRAENEEEIQRLRSFKAQLEGEIIKTERSLHLDSSDIGLSLKKKEDLVEQSKALDKEIDSLQDSISGMTRELAKIKIEKQKAKEKVSSLRSPSLIAEFNTFSEKHAQLSESILKISSEIKSNESQLTAIYQPELDKTRQVIEQSKKEEKGFAEEQKAITEALNSLRSAQKEKESEVKEFYMRFKGLFGTRSKINEQLLKNEKRIDESIRKSRDLEIQDNTYTLRNSEISAILSGLRQEFRQYEGVPLDTNKSEPDLRNEIRKFEAMQKDIGTVNMRALEIYDNVASEYDTLTQKRDKLASEKEDVLAMMKEIDSKKHSLFMKNFEVVNRNFLEIFQQLSTKGATAHLELESPENPFEGGLSIKVRITGNKFLDIRSLSGGEKTMTALAFIFAIQDHEPASFYILDEVDAALDKHNSTKFSQLVKKYSSRAQYIVISHNDGVVSEADTLYGVSMNEHGISQVVSLKV